MATIEEKQLRNNLKALNTRLQAIADRFGTNSVTYQNAIVDIENNPKFEGLFHYKDNGVLALTQSPREINESAGGKHLVNLANKKIKTFSELTKGIEEDFIKEGQTKEERKQAIEEMQRTIENQNIVAEEFKNVKAQFYDLYTPSEREEKMGDMYISERNEKATYDELKEWAERIKEHNAEMERMNADENQPVFDSPSSKIPKVKKQKDMKYKYNMPFKK